MKVLHNNLAIGTSCLGLHPSHTLDQKLHFAAKHGFNGVEIVYGDLESYSSIHGIPINRGAEQIRTLCSTLNLFILSLCPFEDYEGSTTPLQTRLDNASHWLDLARTLGTPHLQVPAQFDVAASQDAETILSDLRALSDLAASKSPVVTIAYEPMSWSSPHSTWQSALSLAKSVARPNFKICIDSFHLASKMWGNPADAATGKYPDADQALAASLSQFVAEFPVELLAYVQLSDGERFDPPYSERHPWYLEGEAKEFTWSRHGRPFPLEIELGGYMPVVEIVRAVVVEKGFRGWVSLETFDRRMREGEVKVEECAGRAERSIRKLDDALQGQKSSL